MKKIKEYIIIIIIGVIVLGGAFYWFELRPLSIKKDCSWIGIRKGLFDRREATSKEYDFCLRQHGL